MVEREEKEQAYPVGGRSLVEGMEQDLGGLAWVDRDCKNPTDEEEWESQVDSNKKLSQGTLVGEGSKQDWPNWEDNRVARPLLGPAGRREGE